MVSPIYKYLPRRIIVAAATLVAVSAAIFAIVEVLPGDIARLMLGPFASEADMQIIRQQLGLERPFLTRYWEWANGLAAGDWGQSWRLHVPIGPLLASRMINSVLLAAVSLLIVVPLSILAGVIAAQRRGRLTDHAITLAGMGLTAIPEFVSSMFLILVFSLWLGVLPASARISSSDGFLTMISALLLPATALGLVLFGYLSRMVRASMVEELGRGYVRTATLKGIAPAAVVLRHALPNALLPAVTVIANQISWLVGGLVVVENVFNYPGIGQLLLQAALGQDVPLLEAVVLVLAAILIVSNLVADLAYGLLNPVVRVGTGRVAP